ncbi:TetR family transcriptional regulator [Streptomyces sp. NPDC056296]|uniref:TetR family transcriptional regulator n=1 Tax=Streptomyces sp. NPDC056296 TaxID=3345775 RepID=UPI0035D8C6DA
MTPPTRRRIDEIGDESRRRILDAAEALFAERGLDRTSFVDIAERSGISRGSIPWHFKNKDGLAMAVVERAIKRAMPPDRYADQSTLHQVVTDYAKLLQQTSPKLLFMILTEAMNSTGTLHEQYSAFLEDRRVGLQRWFRARRPDTVDAGEAVEREKAMAAVINGALIGIQMQWQVDPDSVDLGESLEVLAALIDGHSQQLWSDLGAPDESARSHPRADGQARADRSA